MDRTCYNVQCTNIKQKDLYDDFHSTGEYLYFFWNIKIILTKQKENQHDKNITRKLMEGIVSLVLSLSI